jgi:hypothetical protein
MLCRIAVILDALLAPDRRAELASFETAISVVASIADTSAAASIVDILAAGPT